MTIYSPKILLPNADVDLSKWSVVACDQFTSKLAYWENLKNYIGDCPSTLNFVLPEVYLQKDNSAMIEKINASIDKALDSNIFQELPSGFVLTCRSNKNFALRLGLVVAIDLEDYSFAVGEKPLVRATEGTVLDRLPPRIKIRQNAKVEFPHIMILFDDREDKIIPSLYENRQNLKKLYDFDLNAEGGHIEGYFIKDTQSTIDNFQKLLDEDLLQQKYGKKEQLLFAVGDGNHSLAAAKSIWMEMKKTLSKEEIETCPARYALVELVNIFDKGIEFFPIHRYVKTKDDRQFVLNLQKQKNCGGTTLKVLCDGKYYDISAPQSTAECYKFVQDYLDSCDKEYLDYIHGEEDLKELANNGGVAIFMPSLKKEDLFPYIINFGSLPRKTFSMGEGIDKRYYLEGKRIK